MLQAIYALFATFFGLCIFRYKPQDLPHSRELLLVCLVAYTCINFLLTLSVSGAGPAISGSLLETLLICLFTVLLLAVNHKQQRWLKTLTAITGAGCIIGILALPLFYVVFNIEPGGAWQSLLLMLYLSLLVWNIVIMGNILRFALETTLGFGILYAVIYIIVTSLLVNMLVPAPVESA